MLKPLWGKHPDRLRPPISIPEVGLVPFFLMARVGLANFSLSSFIGVLDWFRIPNVTPLYIWYIHTHTLVFYWCVDILWFSSLSGQDPVRTREDKYRGPSVQNLMSQGWASMSQLSALTSVRGSLLLSIPRCISATPPLFPQRPQNIRETFLLSL